jgi:hypothetical protein
MTAMSRWQSWHCAWSGKFTKATEKVRLGISISGHSLNVSNAGISRRASGAHVTSAVLLAVG